MRVLSIAACATLAGVTLAEAGRMSTTISVDDGASITDCDQIRIRFDDEEALRGEEEITIPGPGSEGLRIKAVENGGIHIDAWDGDHFRIRLCKAVPRGSEGRAQEALGRIRLAEGERRVSVSGPDSGEWIAYMIVLAPARSDLDIQADNGGIGLRNLAGRVEARTENGPISIEGGSGDVSLETENGPIDVVLAGRRWQGVGLDARTENGPVTVRVPPRYEGLRVQTSWHSPWKCLVSQCDEGERVRDRGSRVLDMGGEPLVRVSTANGPVSIETAQDAD